MKWRIRILSFIYCGIYALVLAHSFIPHLHAHDTHLELNIEDSSEVLSTDWLNWLDFDHEDLGEGHLEDFIAQKFNEAHWPFTVHPMPSWLGQRDFSDSSIIVLKRSFFDEIVPRVQKISQGNFLFRGPPIC